MRFHRFATLAAGAALCAATASAQDRADRFVERDLNRDGVLSQSEYTGTGGHPGNFRALDLNGDGVLSRGEFVDRTGSVDTPAVGLPPVGGLLSSAAGPEFARMDTNRDSIVSRGEWTGDMAVFRRIDVNDDRLITTAEYNSYVNPTPSAAGPEFTRMDTNRDSLVSRAEWTGDMATFRRMDVNDDRIVTTSEYVNYNRRVVDGDLVKDPSGALVKDAREFRVLDYDDDGRLTRREWNGDRREFDVMDVNNDGWLSYNEYAAPMDNDGRAVRFRDLDTNRDGRLTRGELRLDRATFRLLDNNNDGRVTREEFRDTRALDNRFTVLDRDRDGRIERREWQGSLDAFRWFDRDRDGRLTRAEFLS